MRESEVLGFVVVIATNADLGELELDESGVRVSTLGLSHNLSIVAFDVGITSTGTAPCPWRGRSSAWFKAGGESR